MLPAERPTPGHRRSLSRALSLVAGRSPAEVVAISVEALGRYKLRTLLSVLGVVLGVAAVIAMMSVTEGARADVLRQVELLGLENVVVRGRGMVLGRDGVATPTRPLTTGDAERLRQLVPLVAAVAPMAERHVEVAGPLGRRPAVMLGTTPDFASVLGLETSRGRFLADVDGGEAARVCVMGGVLARALFGFRDPLGQSVRVEGRWYEVVGILADRAADPRGVGALTARDLNRGLVVPLPAVPGAAPASDREQAVEEIWIHLTDGERVLEVGGIVESTMRRLHRGRDDFEVLVPRQLLNQRYRTQRTFAVVVGSVAALSLLVGGIGIMNIMLASVLERTHEIGIRRTVGATRRDVTVQFLAEALLMTLSGGGLGLLAGIAVSWGITAYAGWSTHVSPAAVLLAVAVSVAVGLTFGIYPATRAARLNPIDAVRYE